jgi:hypothetical protein
MPVDGLLDNRMEDLVRRSAAFVNELTAEFRGDRGKTDTFLEKVASFMSVAIHPNFLNGIL